VLNDATNSNIAYIYGLRFDFVSIDTKLVNDLPG